MKLVKNAKKLPEDKQIGLLRKLEMRFRENMARHDGLKWSDIQTRLQADPGKLWSLNAMEETGGEPDVVGYDQQTGEYIFYDCAVESPKGRRSLCYDAAALESRKEHKPRHSACGLASEMGIEILTERQYRELQQSGPVDQKTSSWISTPADIRAKGGALFCDHRYGHVFLYHNGAESYYAARGFRGLLKV
jgi:hypothetical protein